MEMHTNTHRGTDSAWMDTAVDSGACGRGRNNKWHGKKARSEKMVMRITQKQINKNKKKTNRGVAIKDP
jgi:hypothetical protein